MNRTNRLLSRQRSLQWLFVIGLSILLLSITQAAQAAEYYPACGTTSTLKSAVNNSNGNGEPDYIGLAGAGCVYKLDQRLVIKADGGHPVTIEGNGATISGGDKVQIFDVEAGAVLILQNLTIQEAKGSAVGAVHVYPGATVTVTNTTFYSNRARYGGAFYTGGNVTLTNSTIQGNVATELGGGIFQYDGNVTLYNSFLTLNESVRGGGVWNDGGRFEINNTLVSGNHANEVGGGIYSSGTTWVFDSLIQANRTDGDGGGVYVNGGSSVLIGSTLLENAARKGNGGGLFNKNGSAYLMNTTVALNVADYGGGIHNDGKLELTNTTIAHNTATATAGGLLSTAGTNRLVNVLLAHNQGGDCASSGQITNDGGNWIGDASCIAGVSSGDPKLGVLTAASEFAPRYYPLSQYSPVIDAGVNQGCTGDDQRGASRPLDGNGDGRAYCDPGVYEADTVVVPTATFTDVPTETATPENPTQTPTTDPGNVTPTPTATVTPTATTETPNAGVELLTNGDFELKDASQKSVLEPWTVKNSTGNKVKCNKPEKVFARGGTCAFRFKGGTSETTGLIQNVKPDTVTFITGETLELIAFVNASSPTVSGKVKLNVKYLDPALTPEKLSVNLHPTNGYEKFGGQVTLKSASVAKIKLKFTHRSTGGKVYVDSVSLQKYSVEAMLLPLP